MSRDYNIRYEITTLKDPMLFIELLQSNGYLWQDADTTSYEEDGKKIIIIDGLATLCGGESEEEAHKRIRIIIKQIDNQARVTTRWHCCTDWEWDEEFAD